MSVEIESEDIVRLLLQFFKENNLHASVAALQEETSVTLNTIENRETFIKDITEGKWAQVLEQIMHLDLAPRKLVDLYEQIIIELCEMRELSAARTLLRQTEPMDILKQSQPERYLRLEHLLSRSIFEPKEVYTDGMTKEKQRQVIAQALATDVDVVEPSRLMTLLEDSAKWQQHQGILRDGTRFDVFSSSSASQKGDEDAVASNLYCTIKFPGKGTYAESAVFSPNGQLLVTGSVDGFIEIWNHSNGRLRKDLRYQAEDNLMAMDESVICMAFSRDSEMLVSGSADGKIAVWKVQNGMCQRRFSPAHSQGVTCLSFNKDATLVLSGSYDKLVKIHNIKSGKIVKEFRGHTSFVNAVLYSQDNNSVLSGSSDGTIKIWDVSLGTCIHSLMLDASKTCPVQGLAYIPKTRDHILVSSKSKNLAIISMQDGKVLDTLVAEGPTDILSTALSPQGELVYSVSEDSILHCIRRSTGKLESRFKVCDNEIIGLASHPFSNILAVYDDAGHVYLYKHM